MAREYGHNFKDGAEEIASGNAVMANFNQVLTWIAELARRKISVVAGAEAVPVGWASAATKDEVKVTVPVGGWLRVSARLEFDKTVGGGSLYAGIVIDGKLASSNQVANSNQCWAAFGGGIAPIINGVLVSSSTSGLAVVSTSGAGDAAFDQAKGQLMGGDICFYVTPGEHTVALWYTRDVGTEGIVLGRVLAAEGVTP